MPADKTTLFNSIRQALDSAYDAAKNPEADSNQIRDQYCLAIANAVDVYIKTITITIPSAAIVVTGSSTTQSNPSPILLNGSIS